MTYEHVLSALADPTRRHIFEALRSNALSVTELSSSQTVSRPAVSQHLKVLQEAGLVSVTPQGNRRVYAIRHKGLTALRSYLETFWSDALTAYSNEIQRQTGEEHARTRRKND